MKQYCKRNGIPLGTYFILSQLLCIDFILAWWWLCQAETCCHKSRNSHFMTIVVFTTDLFFINRSVFAAIFPVCLFVFLQITILNRNFKPPLRYKLNLCSTARSRSVYWYLFADVSGQNICTIFKEQLFSLVCFEPRLPATDLRLVTSRNSEDINNFMIRRKPDIN
jgi:hypothetical protein